MTDRYCTDRTAACVAFWIREPNTPYNAKPKHVKNATVQKQYYFNKTKNNPNQNSRPIPWINLRGHWLAQAGFNIDSRYTIEVYENKLVLTVED